MYVSVAIHTNFVCKIKPLSSIQIKAISDVINCGRINLFSNIQPADAQISLTGYLQFLSKPVYQDIWTSKYLK